MAVFSEALSSSRCIFTLLLRNYKYTVVHPCTIIRKVHSTTSENNENYDIIITGGGLVGTTLACALG